MAQSTPLFVGLDVHKDSAGNIVRRSFWPYRAGARAAAGRGWRTFREDLGGLAAGTALVVALVAATALWLKK